MTPVPFDFSNRGNGRRTLFRKEADYAAFERILEEAVERLPMARAGLVSDAQPLASGAVAVGRRRPAQRVHAIAHRHAEERAVQTSIDRSRPFGSATWLARTIASLGLEWTVRPRGRPRVRPERIKDSRPL